MSKVFWFILLAIGFFLFILNYGSHNIPAMLFNLLTIFLCLYNILRSDKY